MLEYFYIVHIFVVFNITKLRLYIKYDLVVTFTQVLYALW